jgi:regulator of RNase E activity RraA/predicted MFS family arabinose efflux permease
MVIPDQGVDPAFVDRSSAARGVVVAVMAVLPVFLTGALAVQLRRDLSFGAAVLGTMVATFFITSALGSPVMGQVVERLGAARAVALATTLTTVACLGATAAQSWLHLVGALALAGVANSIAQPSANLLLSDSIPVRRLGLAFGIKQSCVPGGALIGGLAVPTVALVLGWRWAFGIAGVLTGCYSGWLWLRHTRRRGPRRVRGARLRDSEAPVSSLLFLTVGAFLGAAATTSLGAFLVDSAAATGFAPGTAGWLYALLATGTIVARILLGWAVDRAPNRSRFGVIATLLGVGSFGYLLLTGTNHLLFAVGGLLAFTVGWGWTGLFHYAIVTWYRRSPAAATGFVQTGLSLGAGLGPMAFGIVVEQHGYAAAWVTAGIVSIFASATVFAARAHLRRVRRRSAPEGTAMNLTARSLETPAVSDAMDQRGLDSGVIEGLSRVSDGGSGAVGRARTATVVDSDEPNIPGLAEFLDDAAEGDMLVLGWKATGVASVWGGLAATRTAACGCVGLVTAGWIRDVAEVSSLPLAVWASGTTPRSGKGRLAVVGVGEPAMVGGVVVHDRDLVVSDATGICVVPRSAEEPVLEQAGQLQDRDESFRQALSEGADFGSARQAAGTM